jgi:hypothetical protein
LVLVKKKLFYYKITIYLYNTNKEPPRKRYHHFLLQRTILKPNPKTDALAIAKTLVILCLTITNVRFTCSIKSLILTMWLKFGENLDQKWDKMTDGKICSVEFLITSDS